MYDVFIEQSPNAMAIFDTEMRYLITSKQWLLLFGLEGKAIAGLAPADIFPGNDGGLMEISLNCIVKNQSHFDESLLRKADGSEIWVRWKITPWYTKEENIGGVMIFILEISQQKIIEEQLSIEQRQFRGAFETSSIGMAIIGLKGQWLRVNNSILKLTGYTKEELLALTFQDITHPEDLAADLHLVQELLEGKNESYEMEKRYFHKNGSIIWVQLCVSIVRDAQSNPLHFVSQIIDITESKKMARMRIVEQDKNNNNIAQQLHENIAQTLAAIKLHLHSIQNQNETNRINKIDDTLSGLIDEVKKLSDQIMPTTFIQDNLLFHLEMLTYQYSLNHPIEIKNNIDQKIEELSLGRSLHIYKIIEDYLKLAIMNRIKKVNIGIVYSSDFKIEIEFDSSEKIFRVDENELLLNDIRTRVDILHGSMFNSSYLSEKNICRITFQEYREKGNTSLANIY